MSNRRGRRRLCFACRRYDISARHGMRKNGTRWDLCQQCLDAWNDERKLERETVEFLRTKGAL